jgi:hypothetical protein
MQQQKDVYRPMNTTNMPQSRPRQLQQGVIPSFLCFVLMMTSFRAAMEP